MREVLIVVLGWVFAVAALAFGWSMFREPYSWKRLGVGSAREALHEMLFGSLRRPALLFAIALASMLAIGYLARR